jgi:trehalose 6-phosphate synthase/phosphatase
MSQESGSRVIIVANRLPVTVKAQRPGFRLEESAGGLATGLASSYRESGGVWIGWPGEIARLSQGDRAELDQQLAERSLVPVHLTASQVKHYYEGFSNGVIWPLFHYLLDRIPLDARGWGVYHQVNQRFADAVAAVWRRGDLIWVHDYQLMLVPGLIRQRLPDARIGFFLHIPFPSDEVFRILPWREALLEGLLGSDLIGFHTGAYVRHFATSLRHLLGLEADLSHAMYDGRRVRLDVYPMGVSVADFEQLAADPAVRTEADRLRTESGGRQILLGVDRLDYTKGIPRRRLAFERLLETAPELRDKVRMIQVAVPTRAGVEHYQAFRRGLDEVTGRINGAFGTPTSMPVHYLHRSIPSEQLVALYAAADVMLVTPLRDGMNLVAKEFVASRLDDEGVLVLSEFAGAAAELGEALMVNPYDIDGMAAAMRRALEMRPRERQTRMRALRERVRQHDVHEWAERFIADLRAPVSPRQMTASGDLAELVARIREQPITLLLDYDGTLVPIRSGPTLAAPDDDTLALLTTLGRAPRVNVHLVSGRMRETMESWFAGLPIDLWAEHGLWRRRAGQVGWELTMDVDRAWMNRVRPLIARFTRETAGSLVEEKTASFAWHYRMADPELGEEHAGELRRELQELLHDDPIEVLTGSKVIEVRTVGPSKGLVVTRLVEEAPSRLMVAIGDDRTDEDMFEKLPASSIALHVGPLPSRAPYRVRDWRDVQRILREIGSATDTEEPVGVRGR